MKVINNSNTNRLLVILIVALIAGVAVGLWGIVSITYADGSATAPYTLETGYLDFTYGEEVMDDHTANRPESKVWWNDGFWWASLWNDTLDEYHIYRLDWGTQTWQDTNVSLDDRPESRPDILWDQAAQKLYVASYFKKDNPSTVNSSANWARLYRFTYDEVAETYTLDAGYPVTGINEDKVDELVIDKDSDGKLWASYVSRPQGSLEYQVYINATDGDDQNWQTPYSLYDVFPEARVAMDDIAAIVAFNNTVGVMWTNQLSGTLHFALHNAASDLTSGWVTETVPIAGEIDDHLSLKANSAGQLFAAIKTSSEISDTGDSLIAMVARDTAGQFSYHTYSLAEENDTRPILVVDEGNDQVYIFVSGKPGGSKICYKTAAITAPLSNMAFAPGDCGTDFIADPIYDRIDSSTSSKHPVNADTGLLVLASDDHNGDVYVHNVIGDPPPVITSRAPGVGETDVAPDAVVRVTFSKNMDPATVVAGGNIGLESASGAVAGSVSYDGSIRTATFTPNAVLQAGTVYTVTVTNGVEDTGGKPLYESETWSFQTGSPEVAFSVDNYSVSEDAGTATVTVTLNTPATVPVTVDYATTDAGTAEIGTDYEEISGTLTFDPGVTTQTFTVTILDDLVDEDNETVSLELSNAIGAILGIPSTANLTIVDNEGTPTVQFQPAAVSVDEGAGTATVTVSLSPSSPDPVTVDYTTTDGTATAGSDYTATSGTLTFAPFETTQTFTVTISEDTLDEPNETVNLQLSNPSANAILGAPGDTATLTIVDNDPKVSVAFASASYLVNEDAGVATISVTLSAPSALPVTVNYATAAGSANGSSDYTAMAGTLSFSPGEESKTFTVNILDDALDEPNETVNLVLLNPNSNATLGTPSSAVLTIADDDPMPSVQFDAASYTVNENAGTATITVQLSAPSGQTTAVDYSLSDGTATSSDYLAASGTLDFAVGDTSKSFTVSIVDDNLAEGDETINLTLSNPDDATLGTPSNAVLTITDDDSVPTVQFDSATYTLDENGGTATITVELSGPSGQATAVDYSVSDGSATAGSDYTATNATLNFAAGETSKSFEVQVLDDNLAEGDETVNLTLSNPTGVALGTPSEATLTILDDESTRTVAFSAADYTVNEDAGSATITVELTGPAGQATAVDYTVSDGSATAGSDYTATSGTLNFAAGDTSKSFTVSIVDDDLVEGDETVYLTLSNASGLTLGTLSSATLTITDDDGLAMTYLPAIFKP